MKRIFNLFLIFNLIVCISTHAQENSNDIIRSPQVADMIRYDHTPIALNSGRLDFSVPLLSLTDADFNFPVRACYNSAGFMPSKPESTIGLNWSLNMGGVIYREVRGMPDDLEGNTNLKGFLCLLKDHKSYNPQTVANNAFSHLNFLTGAQFKDSKIEATPDLYRFHFGSYSGSFSIGYDGIVHVVSEKGGSLKVDLSGYEYFTTYDKSTSIKITADNGYQYYFGGSKDNMEYSLQYTNSLGYTSPTVYPSAFFLYKIIAPNGRTLNISYKTLPASYHNNPQSIMDELAYQNTLKNYTTNFTFTGTIGLNAYSGFITQTSDGYIVTNGQTTAYNYNLTKVALIDEVNCGTQKLKFYYSPRPVGEERFKEVGFTLSSRCGALLDSINLQYQGKPVKRVKMQYSWSSGSYPAFFMTQLAMPDSGVYQFAYNNTNNLPNPIKADIDYWNFMRSQNQSSNRIPGVAIFLNDNYKYTSDVREPNPELCDIALLNTITYPTGGSAKIAYEPHTYSKKVDRTSTTAFKPALLNLNTDAKAGGARVKYITYTDQGRSSHVEAYEYTNSKTDLLSSGILYYYPKYFRMEKYQVIYRGDQITLIPYSTPMVIYSNVGLNLPSYEQDHIRYSTVRKVNVEEVSGGNLNFACSPAYESSVLLKVGSLNIKKNIGYWDIAGIKTGGEATIYLKQNGVTKKTWTISETNSIRYVPDVEDGDYEIYGIKTGHYGFTIKVYAPIVNKGFYKESKFTDYSTHPDNFLDDKVYCQAEFPPSNYELNYDRMPQDRSAERGLLLSEESYNQTDERPVESVNYSYEPINRLSDNYTYSVNSYSGYLQQVNKTYYYPVLLRQKVQSRYGTVGAISSVGQTEDYTYNTDGYLSEVSSTNSSSQQVKYRYTYPSDYASDVTCSTMLALNMRNQLIQKEMYVNGALVEKYRWNYALIGTLPVQSSLQRSVGSAALTTYTTFNYGSNQLGRQENVTYRNGLKETWLWSYGYSHVIARIEGLSYEQVRDILGVSLISSIASDLTPTEATVEQIRTKILANVTLGNKAHVTTYLYKPLVGMTQKITPNGEKTSYIYGENNLLHIVRNHNGKTVKQYDYNYK